MERQGKRDAKVSPERLIELALDKWELKGVGVVRIEPEKIGDPIRFVLSMNALSHENANYLKGELERFSETATFDGNNLIVDFVEKK